MLFSLACLYIRYVNTIFNNSLFFLFTTPLLECVLDFVQYMNTSKFKINVFSYKNSVFSLQRKIPLHLTNPLRSLKKQALLIVRFTRNI
jgi:hypothetical protein